MHTIGAWASEVHDLYVGLDCEDVFTDKFEMDLIIGIELLSFKKRERWFSEVRSMPNVHFVK